MPCHPSTHGRREGPGRWKITFETHMVSHLGYNYTWLSLTNNSPSLPYFPLLHSPPFLPTFLPFLPSFVHFLFSLLPSFPSTPPFPSPLSLLPCHSIPPILPSSLSPLLPRLQEWTRYLGMLSQRREIRPPGGILMPPL